MPSPTVSSPARRIDPANPPAVLASLMASGVPQDLYSPAGARLYDRLAEFDTSEQAALLRLLSEDDGEILELACGGGRLALPLLSLGRPVTGVDSSTEMIRLLRRRYDGLPASRRRAPLTAIVGDMRDFSLGSTFGSIVLGTTSLLTLGRRGQDAPLRRRPAAPPAEGEVLRVGPRVGSPGQVDLHQDRASRGPRGRGGRHQRLRRQGRAYEA